MPPGYGPRSRLKPGARDTLGVRVYGVANYGLEMRSGFNLKQDTSVARAQIR